MLTAFVSPVANNGNHPQAASHPSKLDTSNKCHLETVVRRDTVSKPIVCCTNGKLQSSDTWPSGVRTIFGQTALPACICVFLCSAFTRRPLLAPSAETLNEQRILSPDPVIHEKHWRGRGSMASQTPEFHKPFYWFLWFSARCLWSE